MKILGRELHGIPKALVVLAVIMLIASGLCGITAPMEARNHWYWFGPGLPDTLLGNTLKVVDLSAYAAFMISGVLIAALLVVWPFLILMKWLGQRFWDQPEDPPQREQDRNED